MAHYTYHLYLQLYLPTIVNTASPAQLQSLEPAIEYFDLLAPELPLPSPGTNSSDSNDRLVQQRTLAYLRSKADNRFGPVQLECFGSTPSLSLEGYTMGRKKRYGKIAADTDARDTTSDGTNAEVAEGGSSHNSDIAKPHQIDTVPAGSIELVPDRSQTYDIGILHLYRGSKLQTDDHGSRGNSSSSSRSDAPERPPSSTSSECDAQTVLAVLVVPGYMTPLDFITFTGQYQSTISHFRVIRDLSTPNRYMVLLFFESRQDADTFHHFYNGRTFSPLEPELCHVVYLESAVCQMVEHKLPTWYSLLGEAGTADQSAGNDSSTADHRVIEKIVPLKELTLHPRHIPRPPRDQRQGSQDRGNGQEFVELPTCPVCLERLDCTVSGLLTIICQHTFHCRCLSMWGDGNCPVCRYTQMSPFVDQTKFEATIGSLARQRELQLPLSPKINRRAESVGVRDQPQMPKRRDSQGRAKQTSAEPAADHQQQVPDSKRRQQFGKPPGGTVASSISCERSLSAAEGAAEKKSESPSEPDERPRCATCGATQNLWVCLVCGSVGCGRYDSAHAHAHFMKTQHPYSMELESQRVWDYVGDGYVHRLLKNKSDGKLVELPPPTVLGGSAPLVSRLSPFSRRQQQQQQQRSLGDRSLRAPNSDQGLKSSSEEQAMPGSHQYPDPASPHYSSLQTLPSSSGYDTVMREKVDAIAEEYELLLTSQLESQRRHYESLLNDQAKSIRKFQFELKNAAATIKAQSSQISTLKKLLEEQEQARKDHQATICTKFSEFESEVSALRRKLAEERATNEHLRQSQNKLKETLEKNNARISELEEQSNDLMAFLDAKEKIENDETLKAQVEGGSVVVGQSPAETSGGARASKKKKGKSKAKPPVVVRKS